MDLHELKGYTLDVFNHMLSFIHDFPVGISDMEDPDAYFLFAGYSWKMSKFVLWTLHFDKELRKFTYRPASPWNGVSDRRLLMIVGDEILEAKARIVDLLRQRHKLQSGGFDMEPFEVLRDMIRERQFNTIGGPPQVLKIYKHLNCQPYAVFWPNLESQSLSLLGRPFLEYETTKFLALDPDTLEIHKTWKYIK